MTQDFVANLAEVFWHMTWDLCINSAMFFYKWHGGSAPTFSAGIFHLLTHDMGITDQIWQESWGSRKIHLQFFPPHGRLFWMVFTSAVGKVWEAQNKAWRRVWAAHASQAWGGSACLRRVKTNHEKRLGCFMIPKSGAGRVSRRFNAHLNIFLLRLGKEICHMTWDFQGQN